MVVALPVLPHVFKAIEKSDTHRLSLCSESEIRPILPCLVRMSLIPPLDKIKGRKVILCILSGIESVNALVALLSIDFPLLEGDVKREQSLRQKMGGSSQSESILIQGHANVLAIEFECSEPTRRLRLLLSELLLVMAQMKETRQEFYMKSSELFDNECYLEEVSDVLCIALAELPSLLPPAEVAEALLHLSNGPSIICKMVANQPDCFREVVMGLIMNGEKQDEENQGGLIRMQAVRLLCQMNPSQALNVRALCVEQCVMPGLCIYLTLDMAKICESSRLPLSDACSEISDAVAGTSSGKSIGIGPAGIPNNVSSADSDIVSFLTGILLSYEQQQRIWFSQFVKSALRRKFEQPTSALVALRTDLVDRLRNLLLFTTTDTLPDSQVIQATTLLRLYCALKSLAGLKFSEDKEVGLLLQLITCHPPPSAAGVRFVSTGLCMLIACPSLISHSENEKRASEWVKWLVKEEAYFAGASGVSSSSFGAMLLLMAIHFHLQQLSAIIDLVSAALGMKVVITSTTKANNFTRIKHIFTHDVFTEQVLTTHAVKVPVTKDLNANMPGFLPIHCIYHLLKSRMFTKHKVPIKAWIYKQICNCSTPLHPVMPQLIDVYVTSILIPPPKSGIGETFNEPILEEEIMAIFSLSTFTDKTTNWDFTSRESRKTRRNFLRSKDLKRLGPLQRKDNFSLSSCPKRESSRGSTPVPQSGGNQKTAIDVSSVMTSQLLLLYYLLLYEDTRLSNMHQLVTNCRRVHTYSPHLFAQLPIRYLLSSTQREQKLYAGVFSALLKLLVTHYPQLCLLEDWLYQPPSANHQLAILPPRLPLSPTNLCQAMDQAVENPGHLIVLLNRLLQLPPHLLWPMATPLVSSMKCLLKPGVPRKILDTYKLVWLKLNSLFPRRLWAMTVEGLRPDTNRLPGRMPLAEEDIVLDPLYVLRCDQRVFRCAPILEIVIYILQVYLLSSSTFLTQHVQNNPPKPLPPQQQQQLPTPGGNVPIPPPPPPPVGTNPPNLAGLEAEREKLKSALVLTQESAAVQILLEASVDTGEKNNSDGFVLQEIRSIICSFLHQLFIKDTTLAKLVHFQGYSVDLIGPVVEGVPSMHIAVGLSWIPELLQLPYLEKQLFALELTSHLALQNAMPSTLSIARLAVNTFATLLSVLGEKEKLVLMERSLEPLVSIGRAFPPLLDDLVHHLVSYGRVASAHVSLLLAPSPRSIVFFDKYEDEELPPLRSQKLSDDKSCVILKDFGTQELLEEVPREEKICYKIKEAFRKLVIEAAISKELY